ncbi:MAG: T9SS type A sorting domain-containing protein [Mangrovimonas sp.]|nr:T9SS type A sorting domain-containing protein [Mangrovimonas sp.]
MKKITPLYLMLISSVCFAQQYTYMDFGSSTDQTSGNWNNIVTVTDEETGITVADMIDFTGASTGVTLTVNDPFHGANVGGTTSPSGSLPFPSSSTVDSFFGEDAIFSGVLQPTGGFILTGLDPTKYYSFSIFASRVGAGDNRQTQYTLTGLTSQIVNLNPSNNTANVAEVLNLQPNASGEITLVAQPGPSNTSPFGFYYLGAIEMIKSDTTLSSGDFNLGQMLSVYPNPVADRFEVNMNIESVSKVSINLYDINGRLVSNLYDGNPSSGNFKYVFERTSVSNLASGVYFLKVKADSQSQTIKLILE